MRFQHQPQQYHQQREEMFTKHEHQQALKRKRTKLILFLILGFLLLVSSVWAYVHYATPGPYDTFAKCLTEKGAVMYGAINWCKYTQAQAGMFGKSFKYINYHDESELDGIKTRPTWVINGQWYEKVQSFERLSALTGCPLG
ncbi:MAG: hypothetical protein QT02_C0004G0031 [archaeon GW2011_AR9]|nr:MAG: hypothetical protein QT02_C0004G0031 [archaeon GW2011_AR9]MBS3120400.1 hypothetical protein [Candidatus Woesearchaeota archaeon]HIG93842.1 hypothetical protein [Candidatus Woesearchaeota archaeon]HIH12793.1 hypothetical protein [Candidatus Woesearchaeota archaeon]